eukprot:gene4070-5814_t
MNNKYNIKYIKHNHQWKVKENKSNLCMIGDDYSYLNIRDQKSYTSTILKKAVESTKKAISNGIKLIEISFPENRKSDLSVSESLDTTRDFVKEYTKSFSNYKKDLWVVFPDRKESFLASQKWGSESSFVTLSIESVTNGIIIEKAPKLIVFVSPGFNVEEWIKIAKVNYGDIPVIVINGNLDRLRNGYYPRLFYPELGRVTDSFYKKFTPAVFLSPIAVGGDRLGAWLVNIYPNAWEIIVKQLNGGYQQISSYNAEPNPQEAWRLAKSAFK